MSWLSRFVILLALVSSAALVAVLVMYFQEIQIPTLVMAFGLYGLPVAFILGGLIVVNNIRQRNRD